ncbi:MAG TPA: nucleotide disphospho-sugar-binding domain-containing protein [Chloroflexia bacterium]
MARFLIATMPITGHVGPGIPIARKLVERGHEVRWYTGSRFQAKVEATGARYVPMHAAYDFDDLAINDAFPGRAALKDFAQLKFDLKRIFGDAGIGQVADLKAIMQEYPADVILCDTGFAGARLLHEQGGPPWAAFGITALTISSRDTAPFGLGILPSTGAAGHLRNRVLNWLLDNVLFRDVNANFQRIRAEMGLPPGKGGIYDSPISPFLYLQATVPEFEYPRSDLPAQVAFIGPFLPDPPATFTPPAWWDELLTSKRPVIHVTQGTSATDSDQLIVPALQALAGEEVLVVATTGGKPVETVKLDPLPANVRLERFIPYHYLMPHVTAMVTNGGYGGVQTALAHGVPLVVAGSTEDKPEIANRVAWSGTGLNLKTKTPTSDQVRAAVRQVLAEPRFRRQAQQMQAAIAQYDAPAEAVLLLEQLAATRQPVVQRAAKAMGAARLKAAGVA